MSDSFIGQDFDSARLGQAQAFASGDLESVHIDSRALKEPASLVLTHEVPSGESKAPDAKRAYLLQLLPNPQSPALCVALTCLLSLASLELSFYSHVWQGHQGLPLQSSS